MEELSTRLGDFFLEYPEVMNGSFAFLYDSNQDRWFSSRYFTISVLLGRIRTNLLYLDVNKTSANEMSMAPLLVAFHHPFVEKDMDFYP